MSLLQNELNALLQRVQPGQMRIASQRIAELLKQRNVGRIAEQVQPDGTPFKRRKKRKSKPMMPELRHRMDTQTSAKRAEVGFWDLRTPRIHQYGLRDGRAEYPVRELLGLPDADIQAVMNALKAHVVAS